MSEINKENNVQEQENPWVSLGKDLLSVVAVLIAFMVLSKLAFGLWTPMVAVESGSMEPHMHDRRYYFHQKHRSSGHNHE